jgi:ribosomal protein S18 acetylase RimI-like enzyme
MPTHFDIRVAGPADVPCVAAMADGFRRLEGREHPTEAELAERIGPMMDDPDTEFFVAFDGDERCAHDGDKRCAGFLQQRYRRTIWTDGGDAYIETVFVAERARRQGLGKRLVEAAMARARERRCELITLDTNERNVRAIALYEQLGFANTGGPDSPIGGDRQLWFERGL